MELNLKNRRVGRELSKLANRSDIVVTPKDDSLSVLEAQIMGPPDSPYENGTFTVLTILSYSPNCFYSLPNSWNC